MGVFSGLWVTCKRSEGNGPSRLGKRFYKRLTNPVSKASRPVKSLRCIGFLLVTQCGIPCSSVRAFLCPKYRQLMPPHLGIAYMTACTLGLDFRDSTPSLPAPNSSAAPDEEWLDAEKMRRCFWAVWFTQCINADHTSMRSYYIDRIMDLPLPIDETSFSQRARPQSYTFANVLNGSTSVQPRQTDNTSIMAELMILILHWYFPFIQPPSHTDVSKVQDTRSDSSHQSYPDQGLAGRPV